MSLRKKPTRTEERVAARHTNGRRWHGPTTLEGRDRIPVTDLAPSNLRATLMVRMEDCSGRQDGRITNLLLKVKRHQRQIETLEQGDEKHARVSRDILQNKGVIG